jgi:hypothetical protein
MIAFVFLPAISGNSRCSVLVPLTNTVLLLGGSMLPTWRWVKISTYLHLEPFLLITYMLLVLARILSLSLLLSCYNFLCYNSDQYCYYSYVLTLICIIIIIVTITNIIFLLLLMSLNYYYCYNILFRNPNVFCPQLLFPIIFVCLCICLFSVIMCSCNLSLTLCCDSPLCTYVYMHCVVSVTGLLAVDSAHK